MRCLTSSNGLLLITAAGVGELIPLEIPEQVSTIQSFGVEAGAYFERYQREGKSKYTSNPR